MLSLTTQLGPNSSLSALPFFIEVVKCGSFSKAADRLNITKSAVSKRVNQLETSLGIKLLHRTTRKLTLTEAGNRYYQAGLASLEVISDAENEIKALQVSPAGKLRVNVPTSFGISQVSPILPKFLRMYPSISVDLVLSDTKKDLIGEGFDLALQTGELPDSTYIAKKLAPLNSVVCGAKNYIKEKGMPSVPADLMDHNCLLYAHHTNIAEWVFMKQSEKEIIKISGNFVTNVSDALVSAAIDSAGLARLPTFLASSHILSGTLTPVLTDYTMPSKDLYAVYPDRKFVPEKVKVFLKFLVDNFGVDEPSWEKWKQIYT